MKSFNETGALMIRRAGIPLVSWAVSHKLQSTMVFNASLIIANFLCYHIKSVRPIFRPRFPALVVPIHDQIYDDLEP